MGILFIFCLVGVILLLSVMFGSGALRLPHFFLNSLETQTQLTLFSYLPKQKALWMAKISKTVPENISTLKTCP